MSTEFDALLDEIQREVATLEQWRSHEGPLPWEAADHLSAAYRNLDDMRRQLPGTKSYVVMKCYGGRTPRDIEQGIWEDIIWPYMVFPPTDEGRERAELWADFLADYYHAPHRKSQDVFYVMLGESERAHYAEKPWDRPIGDRYYPESYHGTGCHTVRWKYERPDGLWVREAPVEEPG